MRRLVIVLMAALCCVMLALPVAAQSQASHVRSETTVDGDGSCRVVITATVVYGEAVSSPVFPIPSSAENVVLDGSPATVYTAAGSRMVSLKDVTRGNAGTFTFTISYYLPSVVVSEPEQGMILRLDLLSGFPYPIDRLEAVIYLPGDPSGGPGFTSGYHQEAVEDLLGISVDGSRISVTADQMLKDHETLTMELPVDAAMFPDAARTARVLGITDILVVVAVLLAVVYYWVTMKPALPRRPSRATAPDGVSAGDLAVWATGGSVDLSLMVVTWAQLGYLRIQVEDSGRVLLHKRMDMGNERSAFENRCYKELFGRRRILDGTGFHYAQLCRSVMKKSPRVKEVYRKLSGDPRIFRGLCALGGGICGVAIGGALASHATWLMALLGVLTAVLSWQIQSAGRSLLQRDRFPLLVGGVCAAVWMLLGLWSGEWIMALLVILVQFFGGVALAYGGKRTELGQQVFKEMLGLRRFMGRVSKRELQQLLKTDPSYFHELAPYALALGVDRTFARRFGRLRLPECTYLICADHRQMTASEWAALLRTTVNTLDARARRLPLERLTGR